MPYTHPSVAPDYTWSCESLRSWSVEVEGDSGTTYTVSYGKGTNDSENPVGFSCTCKAYQFRVGPCKHVDRVADQWCGWTQVNDPKLPRMKDGQYFCPECDLHALASPLFPTDRSKDVAASLYTERLPDDLSF